MLAFNFTAYSMGPRCRCYPANMLSNSRLRNYLSIRFYASREICNITRRWSLSRSLLSHLILLGDIRSLYIRVHQQTTISPIKRIYRKIYFNAEWFSPHRPPPSTFISCISCGNVRGFTNADINIRKYMLVVLRVRAQ